MTDRNLLLICRLFNKYKTVNYWSNPEYEIFGIHLRFERIVTLEGFTNKISINLINRRDI